MNRVRLGLLVLLLLMILCCGTAWYVRTETQSLLDELNQMAAIAEEQSLDAAADSFAAFQQHWEKSERILNLMVWRDRVVQMDITVSHLDPMRAKSSDELESELSEARMWLERIGKGELPLLRNIF